jgi:organic radical activating enzyme
MDLQLTAVEVNQPYLAVTWQVSDFCNFKCSYCNPGNWGGKYRNEDNVDTYIKNLTVIINKYRDAGYKDFKFFFSGGEPTAWKNFLPICEWLRTELPNCTLAVNTNLSRPLAWWETHYKLFDDVVASFHIEFADKEKYFENTLFLCDKVNYLSSKMLMHDDRFWEVVEYGESLKQRLPNYFIEWTPLFDEISVNAGPWQYNDPEKTKWINEHNIETKYTIPKPYKKTNAVSFSKWSNGTRTPINSNDIIVKGQNFFQGWNCKIGDSVFINPKGDVSMASCGQGEQIGHILHNVEGVGPREIICNKHHCVCGTDIIIPKFKL